MTHSYSATFPNQLNILHECRKYIEHKLTNIISSKKKNDVCFVSHEAATNIISHSFTQENSGTFTVTIDITSDLLSITFVDTAPLMDLAKIKPRHLSDIKPNGLGTYFMLQLSDKVIWTHKHNQNHVIMYWHLSTQPAAKSPAEKIGK